MVLRLLERRSGRSPVNMPFFSDKLKVVEESYDLTEALCVFAEGFLCARAHRTTQAGL